MPRVKLKANTVSRTLNELNEVTQKAITHSKETATSTAEMLETHTMLRADTTAMFERLREANIMLQEVLSGAHENMSALENTLMVRVSEFVGAMKEITASTGDATGRVETNIETSAISWPRSLATSASLRVNSMFTATNWPRRSK